MLFRSSKLAAVNGDRLCLPMFVLGSTGATTFGNREHNALEYDDGQFSPPLRPPLERHLLRPSFSRNMILKEEKDDRIVSLTFDWQILWRRVEIDVSRNFETKGREKEGVKNRDKNTIRISQEIRCKTKKLICWLRPIYIQLLENSKLGNKFYIFTKLDCLSPEAYLHTSK